MKEKKLIGVFASGIFSRVQSNLYNAMMEQSKVLGYNLVFFAGTYDTDGVSHCAIYVGNNMMIHCGDPIQYANLNSSYWQQHFYCYGRLPQP